MTLRDLYARKETLPNLTEGDHVFESNHER